MNQDQRNKEKFEHIELDLFLDALAQFHGYNLKGYSRSSMMRRIKSLVIEQRLDCISALIPLLAQNVDFRSHALNHLMVNVSSLFRDPEVFASLKQQVFPYLESFPRLTIWIAGCAEGLEAYSLAVLLHESGLLNKTRIFATDINTKVLKQAASGVLSQSLTAEDATRYNQSLGQKSLSDYFTSAYGKQKLKQELLAKITFEHHDLVQQPPFITTQLTLCRNVLIYFENELKEKVVNVLSNSLEENGHLVIGTKESIEFLDLEHDYKIIDSDSRIYKKAHH